jgi:hypothetical protein
MDLTTLEANKNVVLSALLVSGTPSFSQNVQIPFMPDYMIVRGINYSPDNADPAEGYLIYCDLVSDYIGSFIVNDVTGKWRHQTPSIDN